MDSGKCFVPISHGTYESVGPLFVKLIGSFSNDDGDGDGDGNENVKTAIGFLGKTTTLHVQHAFLTRQDKTRQDIYYRNITSTIFWHAVSKKTLVEVCQINSITNQILYYNK